MDEFEKWLRVQEVADRLGVAATTVYGLCERKRIQHIRVGTGRGAIRISAAALEAFLRSAVVEADTARADAADLPPSSPNP